LHDRDLTGRPTEGNESKLQPKPERFRKRRMRSARRCRIHSDVNAGTTQNCGRQEIRSDHYNPEFKARENGSGSATAGINDAVP
jgi:hypothetical protein